MTVRGNEFTCPATGFSFTKPTRWQFMPGAWMRPEREAALPRTEAGERQRLVGQDPIAVCYWEHRSPRHLNPTAQLFRRPWDGTGTLGDAVAGLEAHFVALWPDTRVEVATDRAMFAGHRAAHYVLTCTQTLQRNGFSLHFPIRLRGFSILRAGYILTFTVSTPTQRQYRADADVEALIASARCA